MKFIRELIDAESTRKEGPAVPQVRGMITHASLVPREDINEKPVYLIEALCGQSLLCDVVEMSELAMEPLDGEYFLFQPNYENPKLILGTKIEGEEADSIDDKDEGKKPTAPLI